MVIIGNLIWTTYKGEASRPATRSEGTLSNGPTSKDNVRAFTTTSMLADYLIAASGNDTATVEKIIHSSGSILLDAGTRIHMDNYSGPGQTKVRILSGPHAGETVYVSYATVQEASK